MSLGVKGPMDYVSELDFEELKLQSPKADATVEARKKNVEDAGYRLMVKDASDVDG